MHTGAASATTYAAPVTVFTQTPNLNVVGANLIAIADVNGDGLNDLVITDPGPDRRNVFRCLRAAAKSGESRHIPESGRLRNCFSRSAAVHRRPRIFKEPE